MARLEHRGRGEAIPVSAQCLIGRSPTCAIRIDDKYASSEHAKLVWGGARWTVRDLGSRNGTFVSGKRLEPGKPVALERGATLGFGDVDEAWTLVDDGPPGALAIHLPTGAVRASEGEILVLPDDDHPELSIYPAADGVGWVAEDAEGEARPVRDHGVVIAGDGEWRLELPVMSEATPMVDVAMNLSTVDLVLAVSRNEERVEITLMLHGIGTPLEPREHGYLLLTLARARAEDADKPPEDRGWRSIPELQRMLRLEPNALNVAIHRARQQLAAAGLEGAAGIVEVQRGARRLGTERFSIVPLPD